MKRIKKSDISLTLFSIGFLLALFGLGIATSSNTFFALALFLLGVSLLCLSFSVLKINREEF